MSTSVTFSIFISLFLSISARCGTGPAEWKSLDIFENAAARDTAVDSHGNQFAVGGGKDPESANSGWLVRGRRHGKKWVTLDVFSRGGRRTSTTAVSIDSADRVFVTGQVEGPENSIAWLTRMSTDSGKTWATVDEFSLTPLPASVEIVNSPSKIAVDASGKLFVVGNAFDFTSQEYRWIVRESCDHGSTWQTVDIFWDEDENSSNVTAAASVTISKDGSIYVSGSSGIIGTGTWLVRKSSDSGKTWKTVDRFNYAGEGTWGESTNIISDSDGTVYVSGTGATPDPHEIFKFQNWIIRKSSDAGKHWQTIDDFTISDFRARATALAISGGKRYAGGFAEDPNGHFHWMVHSLNKSGQWIIVDRYYQFGLSDQFVC